jgi:hypothetical protein
MSRPVDPDCEGALLGARIGHGLAAPGMWFVGDGDTKRRAT